MMHVFIDLVLTVKNILWGFLVAWVRFFGVAKKKSVKGEIVLVTGAASGMGQEIALEFSKLGAILVLWDINQEGLEKTAHAISSVGGTSFSYICDVGDRLHVSAVGTKVKAEVGDVTLVVNNAGVVSGKALLDLSEEDIDRTFNTNLLGQIWVIKEFLPSMLENNHGHVVNMGSSCGLIGVSRLTDYSASKFGVVGLTEVLHYELHFTGHDGVHTTLVNPSFVRSGMFQGCRMVYPIVLPDLEVQPTVQRIMKAVLTNQTHCCIPRVVYFMAMLKTILPVSAFLEIIQFFRADQFMDTFVGRAKSINAVAGKEE